MGARNSRVLHRRPARNTSEGDRRRRRMAHCGGRPPDPRCFGRRCLFPVSDISIHAFSMRYRGKPRSSPMPIPASSHRSRQRRWPTRLVGDEPGGLAYAYFVSADREAIAASIKLARQYFIESGQPQRQRFIARRQSYHGNTLGRWLQAETPGGANPMRRCCRQPLAM